MFTFVDTFLINCTSRFMRYLNEHWELTAPKVLRESLLAFMAAYAAFGLAVMSTGDLIAQVAVVVFGSMMYPNLTGVLKRYAADADKDWTSTLAMKYMALAIGKQISMRMGRLLGWISVILYPLLSWIASTHQSFLFTFVYCAAMASGLIHEYLAAAEPTAPGERRRSAVVFDQLAHQTGR